MSGAELIAWAVAKCEADGIPPTDAAILEIIRNCGNVAELRR